MRKITGFSLIPMLALLLASCGGGGGGTDLMPPAIADSSLKVASATGMVMTASQSPQRTSTSAGLSSTQLFDWAESRYPAYFPGHQANQVWAPYTYRYYPATQAYLGVDGAVVRVFGPVFGPDIVTVGTLNQFVCDVTPQNCLAPTANATAASTAVPGSVVTLDGRASADPNGEALTFTWSLVSRPTGSGAILAGSNTAQPSFTPDLAGAYQVRLVVNNGFVSSPPSSVTITATGTGDPSEPAQPYY